MTIMYNRSRIWLHGSEIWSFSQLLPQTGVFRYNRRLTSLNFESKFEIFKTHKNLYTWPLCKKQSRIWASRSRNTEFRSFFHKLAFFGKLESYHLWILSQNLNF
jgi:hypothetical protein